MMDLNAVNLYYGINSQLSRTLSGNVVNHGISFSTGDCRDAIDKILEADAKRSATSLDKLIAECIAKSKLSVDELEVVQFLGMPVESDPAVPVGEIRIKAPEEKYVSVEMNTGSVSFMDRQRKWHDLGKLSAFEVEWKADSDSPKMSTEKYLPSRLDEEKKNEE